MFRAVCHTEWVTCFDSQVVGVVDRQIEKVFSDRCDPHVWYTRDN